MIVCCRWEASGRRWLISVVKDIISPLLLLYANPDGEPICTKTAPQKTVIVKETKFFNNNDENGRFLHAYTDIHLTCSL